MRRGRLGIALVACLVLLAAVWLARPVMAQTGGGVRISEVMYRPIDASGGLQGTWVELYNAGSITVDLGGWSIVVNGVADALAGSIAPGSYLVIAASSGVCDGYPACGLRYTVPDGVIGGGLADSGAVLMLQNGGGFVADTLSYGANTDACNHPLSTAPGQSLQLSDLTLPAGSCAYMAAAPGPWAATVATPDAGTPTAIPQATSPTTQPVDPTPDATTYPQDLTPHHAYLPSVGQRSAEARRPALLISEVLYDGTTADDGDEFVELRNYTGGVLPLAGYRLGDAERAGDGEGMYAFPGGASIWRDGLVTVARCAASFAARFGARPDFEFRPGTCPDSPDVTDMVRDAVWGRGSFALADAGDEVVLLAPDLSPVDAVAYGAGDFTAVGLTGEARAAAPLSLQRVAALDGDDMSLDFAREAASPSLPLDLPAAPPPPASPAWQGLYCFWGNLHAHTSSSDGSGPAELAFARARAAGLHFYAITDHDHMLRPVEWSRDIAAANRAAESGAFAALAGIEWSSHDEGHVNVLGITDYLSHDDPATAGLAGLYEWVVAHGAIAQFNHPGLGASFGGASVAPSAAAVHLLEVGNGSIGDDYRLFQDELLQAWRNGWHVAPSIGADTHTTSWGSDTSARTGVWAETLTPQALLAALAAGRAFATEDADAAVAWRCGGTWMGGEAEAATDCVAYYVDGEDEPATLAILGFDGIALDTQSALSGQELTFALANPPAGVWLRLTQADGDRLWSAPIWFTSLP